MVEVSFDPIREIALEINNLVQCPKILGNYRQNLREWCELEERRAKRRQEDDASLAGLYRKLFKKLEKGGDLERICDEIDRHIDVGHGDDKLKTRQRQEIGPAPLFLRSDEEFQACHAYAMTAIAHDLMIDEVRGNAAYPVQRIYPGGREFAAYYVCIHETETQKETQIKKHELKARPLRQAIEIVKKNLCAVGLLNPDMPGAIAVADRSTYRPSEVSAGSNSKRPGRKIADYETQKREAQIAADWEQASQAKERKKDFVKRLKPEMSQNDFKKLLDRVAWRKRHPE